MRHIALLLLTVAVASASVSITRTSNDAPHPSTMELEVTLPDSNKKVLIPLERTDAFENIPMTVIENGVSRTFSSHQVHHASHAHYRDIATKSVISVRHEKGKRQVSGHVMHEGTSYFLEPVGETGHQVTKNARTPEIMARQIESRKKRQANKESTQYTVELYLLLDNTVWNTFLNIYGSESSALVELHYYYTHILNGIDTTYRNIGTPSISVSCIGITISKTAADDAWMPAGNLDGSAILKQMVTYTAGKTGDHFMAFTRSDITGGGSSSVCGMAYVGGACKSTKVSINEDMGLQSWGTAAHELGHNLGSEHDGSGNTCDATLKNIMSPSLGFYNVTTVCNSYKFSSCSVNYINNYVTSSVASCLLTAQGTRVSNLSTSEREGARMTLDQVCRITYPNGPGTFFLSSTSESNPASICASIYCTTASGSGTARGGLRAPAGTSCGNKKSCDWKGQCSYDASAPAIDDSCFWGDSSSSCATTLSNILSKKTKCTSSTKKKCCRTLAGLAECAGV